ATIKVDDDGAQCATPYHTIQAGVGAAAAGDTVQVCPGVYSGPVVVDKAVNVINKPSRTATVSAPANQGNPEDGSDYTPPAGNPREVGVATLTNNTIRNYAKEGVYIDNIGSKATLKNNTLTGDGCVGSGKAAENGVQISRGAKGTLLSNNIGANCYTGDSGGT